MNFETVNQNEVKIAKRNKRTSKYETLFVSLKELQDNNAVVIKTENGKSVLKLRQNLSQALRNSEDDQLIGLKIRILEDQTGVVITK